MSLFLRKCTRLKCLNISATSETLMNRVIKLSYALARSVFTTYWCSKFDRGKSTRKPLKQWTLDVKPFGTVKMRVPCEVTVRPLDPHQLDTDKAFVTVFGDITSNQTMQLNNLEVKYDASQKQLLVLSDKIDSNSCVIIAAPVRFDLDIKTTGTGNVNIKNMENKSCRVETEYGAVILNSLKSHYFHVKTKGGNIIGLGTIYGNTEIYSSNKSTVTINKVQGPSVSICVEDGVLQTKYLYAESSNLSTALGNIELGSIHGKVDVETIGGNITIDSLDGCLKASTTHGDIDVYISRLKKADLKSLNGSVTVKVPTLLQAYLKLSGIKVDINQEIHLKDIQEICKDSYRIVTGSMNQRKEDMDRQISVDAFNGTIYLKSQNWFESLKL